MIKLLLILAVAGLSIGTAHANYRFVTYWQGGRLVQCTVFTDLVGNETWNCI